MIDLSFIFDFINNKRVVDEDKFINYEELNEYQANVSYIVDNNTITFSSNIDLIIGKNFFIINEIIFKLKYIKNNKAIVEQLPLLSSFTSQKIFIYDYSILLDKQKENYNKQKKIISAIIQAERELKACKAFIIPQQYDNNIHYALGEWALFLLKGEVNQEIIDQKLGIKKKKIDVLEWEYTDNNKLFPEFGCQAAWNYLSDYINPDYNNISNTIVTLS